MRPCLRRLNSPDVEDLTTFVPRDPAFAVLVPLMVGPCGEPGEESFDIIVCSAEWLQQQPAPVVGRHHLVVRTFNYAMLVKFVEDYLLDCAGGLEGSCEQGGTQWQVGV